jgi:cytochrome c biogenesis protein CcmG/thiol:disulfide interchange protein DsbE
LVGLASLFWQKKSSSITNLIETKLQNNKQIDLPKFSLVNLDNSKTNFSNDDLLGKYSVINFFASWCSSCRAENDLLINLSQNDKIIIFGVAWRDIDQSTKNYLNKNGNPYSKVGVDSKGTFAKSLGVSAMPESFVINPQGKIIYYQKGAIDDNFIWFLRRMQKP